MIYANFVNPSLNIEFSSFSRNSYLKISFVFVLYGKLKLIVSISIYRIRGTCIFINSSPPPLFRFIRKTSVQSVNGKHISGIFYVILLLLLLTSIILKVFCNVNKKKSVQQNSFIKLRHIYNCLRICSRSTFPEVFWEIIVTQC